MQQHSTQKKVVFGFTNASNGSKHGYRFFLLAFYLSVAAFVQAQTVLLPIPTNTNSNIEGGGKGFTSPIVYKNKLYYQFGEPSGFLPTQLVSYNGTSVTPVDGALSYIDYGEYYPNSAHAPEIVFNDFLYYFQYDVKTGINHLARYDGNTITIIPTPAGYSISAITNFIVYNNMLCFYCSHQLAVLNGNTINVMPAPTAGYALSADMVVYKNNLYFQYLQNNNPATNKASNRLLKFDGTSVTLVPNVNNSDNVYGNFFILKDTLYFQYATTSSTVNIGKYDGTKISTVAPNGDWLNTSYSGGSTLLNNEAYFVATSSNLSQSRNNLIKFDGNKFTTIPEPHFPYGSSTYSGLPLYTFNGAIYYNPVDYNAPGIMVKYDGTTRTEISVPSIGKIEGIIGGKLMVSVATYLRGYDGSTFTDYPPAGGGYGFQEGLVSYNGSLYWNYLSDDDNYYIAKYAIPCTATKSTFTVSAAGNYTWHGKTYTVSTNTPTFDSLNAAGCDSLTTLNLTITPANAAPTFDNGATQRVTYYKNQRALGINYLMGVTDVENGQTETYTVSKAPSHGSVTIGTTAISIPYGTVTPDGWAYQPATGFVGTDQFDITVNDGNGGTATNTIKVNVYEQPTVTANVTTAATGSIVTFTPNINIFDLATIKNVYWNDVDEDNTLGIAHSAGNFTYAIPTGVSSFTIMFSIQYVDINGNSNYVISTLLTIPVTAPVTNTVPTFDNAGQGLSLCQNATATDFSTLLTVSDADASQTETFSITNNPSHGTIATGTNTTSGTSHSPTSWVYTPTAGYSGIDAFAIKVDDGNGGTTNNTISVNIKQPTTSTLLASACGSYTWNGTTYSTSGIYTLHLTNAVGCDSIATLNLTIKKSSTLNLFVNVCTNYIWHGTTCTKSGVYTYTTTNAIGCDSIVTLNLHLKTVADVLTINGTNNSCVSGKATQLSSNFVGGIWASNTSNISVDNNGLVTANGATNTVANIKYYCAADSDATAFSYLPFTVIGSTPITGPTAVCTGSTIQLQTNVLTYPQNVQNNTSGAWSVQNTTRGTINQNGVLTAGSLGGNPIVIYTLTNKLGCTRSLYDIVTLNVSPSAKPIISGSISVCTQNSVQLSASPAGASNTWSIQNPLRGSITNSGLLTGASPNANAIVTYKYADNNGCSSPTTYYNVFVNVSSASPHVTTLSGTYCVGSSYNFAATPVGGTWSANNAVASITSSNTSVATAKINSAGSFGIVYKTAADVNGCKATTTFTRSTTTCVLPTVVLDTLSGSLEVARVQAGSLNVYPNPARGVVTLNVPSVSANSSFSIADITGKIVRTQVVTNKQTKVNISGLKSGIYFISIQSAEGKTTKKLIINN